MEEGRIAMSQKERDRLKVMSTVLDGKRTQAEAARLLKRSVRQVRRLQRKLELQGDPAIVHKLRARPSNHRIDPAHREGVLAQYRARLLGFGPTFAAEKLRQMGLPVAVRTLRDWLLAEGLWQRQRRRDKHRRRRERRPCRGELVQADGSHHDWLEGRGPRMVLLVMIDDATSETLARFYPAETTEAYMDLLGRYIRRYGRMLAIYADGDSVFQAQDRHRDDPQPQLTQFGRALQELDIELIHAGSPQAKGRVERFNGTAQDRLVKELRLADASTLSAANCVLEDAFLPWFNRQCTVTPESPNDAHRRLHTSMDLEAILSIQATRQLANDYTIRFQNRIYQLLPPAWPGLRGGKVVVEKRLDGSLHLRFKGRYLAYQVVTPAKERGGRQEAGAPPPHPWSLPHGQTPARECNKRGSAVGTAEPRAVRPATGRSGRTPAEPYPPGGARSLPARRDRRPAPDHPWRKGFAHATAHP